MDAGLIVDSGSPILDAGVSVLIVCPSTGCPCDGPCPVPSCTDGIQNGGETSPDCGGPCPDCGQLCHFNGDCASNLCWGLRGPDIPTGKCSACTDGKQCDTLVCVAGVCAQPTCSDGAWNGAETDVDCGGPTCAPCGAALHCLLPSDCASGVCNLIPNPLDCVAGSSQCRVCGT